MNKNQTEQNSQKIKKNISEKFTTSYMSNSKWVRLINKFVEQSEFIKKINFKTIYNDKTGELFIDETTSFNFDYWQTGFEGNNSLGGWILYKEIEFLEFPKYFENNKFKGVQDIKKIIEIIESVGKFQLVEYSDKLKMLCYE